MTSADASDRFATFVQGLRTTRNVSLSRLAAQAGVAKSTLSRWETGQALPRLPELQAVLNALDASAAHRRQAIEMIGAPRALAVLRDADRRAADQAGMEAADAPSAGDLLRAMRLRRGLTVDEVASALDVSARSVRAWEHSDARLTAQHLHSLCRLLGATEQEISALTAGTAGLLRLAPLPLCASLSSLDAIRAYMNELAFSQGTYDPAAESLKDLAHLALLSRLTPLAVRYTSARLLLINEYATYAHWLSNQRRYPEAARFAQKALTVAGEAQFQTNPWMRAAIIAARADVYGGNQGVTPARARRGMEQLQVMLPFALTQAPEFAAWAMSDMAEYRAMAGETEAALDSAAQAYTVAERCKNADEPSLRRFDQARLLLKVGRAHEALALLPSQEPAHLPQRMAERLLRAEALLTLGSRSEAHDWLNHVYAMVRDYGFDSRDADRLSQRF